MKGAFVFCTQDLYSMSGELRFKAGKRYPLVKETRYELTLRNEYGGLHGIDNTNTYKNGWLQYFIIGRLVLFEKIRSI